MAKRRSAKLTDEDIAKLSVPKSKLLAIPNIPNLFLRFGKKGRTFYAVARRPGGKQVWTKIGRAGPITLEEAEAITARIVKRIRVGEVGQEAPAAITLANVVESYRVKVGRHQRRWDDKERRLAKWLLPTFGKVPFLEIRQSQVNALLDKIEETSARIADQVLVDLQALEKFFLKMPGKPDGYQFRFRGGLVPKRGVKVERERVLDDDELRAVWTVADGADRFGVIVKLCLLTAQRLDKVLSMRWEHIKNENEWHIPRLPGEKGVPKALILPPPAVALIKTQVRLGPWVFPSVRGTGHMIGLSQLKREFTAQLPKMPRWGMHDLRRTARTMMSKAKVDFFVAEAILGHKIGGVAGIYQRDDFVPEMATALVALANRIESIVEVVPLAKAG